MIRYIVSRTLDSFIGSHFYEDKDEAQQDADFYNESYGTIVYKVWKVTVEKCQN